MLLPNSPRAAASSSDQEQVPVAYTGALPPNVARCSASPVFSCVTQTESQPMWICLHAFCPTVLALQQSPCCDQHMVLVAHTGSLFKTFAVQMVQSAVIADAITHELARMAQP